MPDQSVKFRAQTNWTSDANQVDLIGRAVEYPGPKAWGAAAGGGFGEIIAHRKTTQGPQCKVARTGGGELVIFQDRLRKAADVSASVHGDRLTLTPQSTAARAWFDRYGPTDAPRNGRGYVLTYEEAADTERRATSAGLVIGGRVRDESEAALTPC